MICYLHFTTSLIKKLFCILVMFAMFDFDSVWKYCWLEVWRGVLLLLLVKVDTRRYDINVAKMQKSFEGHRVKWETKIKFAKLCQASNFSIYIIEKNMKIYLFKIRICSKFCQIPHAHSMESTFSYS